MHCAAVRMRSRAITTPLQNVLSEPTTITTCRATLWLASGAPPTSAAAGNTDSRAIPAPVIAANFMIALSSPQAGNDMNCKSDQIRAAWDTGDRIGALRIAARFFDRSIATRTFKRGIGAYNNPSFYRQLGKDPERIVRDALDVLAKRFNLH
jgi:hypothetical protein